MTALERTLLRLFCLCAALTLTACGDVTSGAGDDEDAEARRGDSGAPARDIGGLDDTPAPDAGSEDTAASDTATQEDGGEDAEEADVGGDTPSPDATSDTTDDVAEDVPMPDTSGVCGDGRRDPGETCDDGNRTAGDGCDATCQRELPDLCTPCTVNIECGGQLDYCVEGFCAAACGEGCPPGTTCTAVPVGLETIEQCLSDVACDGATERCANGTDDDGDRLVDCDDPDCVGDPACAPSGVEACSNGVDDDGDRLVDCDDPDCVGALACAPPELCTNGIDDDGDRLVDCDDPDCSVSPSCAAADPELCTNGVDDDGDRLVDCDDPDCAPAPACVPPELCTNGVDDDGDRLVDCNDPDCALAPACDEPTGGATCDAPRTATIGGQGGTLTPGAGPLVGACGGSGNEEVWAFVAPEARTYCVDTFGSSFDTVLYARTACASQFSEEDCNDDAGASTQSEIEFRALAGETIYLVVDAFRTTGGGSYSLNVSNEPCGGGTGGGDEICDNGVDDDGDFSADCRDSDCIGDPACIETDCDDGVDNDDDFFTDCSDPDCDDAPACRPGGTVCEDAGVATVGTLTGDVGAGSSRMTGSCGGNGPEQAWTFVAPSTGSFCVDTRGTGFDTVLYARTSCSDSFTQTACNDDASGRQSEIELDLTAGEEVTLFVDAYVAGLVDSSYTLNIFEGSCDDAYPEICDNGVDDDGDFSTDCSDSDCEGDPACTETVCDDGVDNDDDFYTDCSDSDCDDDPACQEVCDDGVDNDGDFSTDCFDSDCEGDPACAEVCDDDIDNDRDFRTDCSDSDCEGDPACTETACDDGVDNDGDFSTDCFDSDCDDAPACRPGGTVCEDATSLSVGTTNGTLPAGSSRMSGSCGGSGGPEEAWTFVAPSTGAFCFDTVGTAFDTVLYAREDCSDSFSQVACNDDNGGPQSEIELNLTAGDTISVFVDAYRSSGAGSPYTLNVFASSCDDAYPEICDNGTDDDDDFFTDCNDPDCDDDPACIESICDDGIDNDGDFYTDCNDTDCEGSDACRAYGCDDPHTFSGFGTFSGDSTNGEFDLGGTCGGSGREHVIAWTSPVFGDVCIDSSGSAFDTVLHARTTCASQSSQIACNDDVAGSNTSRIELTLSAGDPVFVVIDGYSFGSYGDYEVTFSNGPCP